MAMKDIKSIEVEPAEEETIIQLWMSFGWELKNNQRVKTQDVQKFKGQDRNDYENYEIIRGVDFIKLTFERDPERKNYAELKELEEQYYAPLPTLHTSEPGSRPTKPGIISLIFIIVGLIFGVFRLVNGIVLGGNLWLIISGIVLIVLGVRGILRRRSFPSRLKYWKTAYEVYQTNHAAEENAIYEAKEKRANALQKARSLV